MRHLKQFKHPLWMLFSIIVLNGMISYQPVSGFGKNKITYERFQWKLHQTDHFEFYYYPDVQNQLPEVIRYFESAYNRISSDLGFELSARTPVILYLTHVDFQQTNILEGFIPQGVAGFSEPIKRRIVIPLDGSRKDLELLIIHELVHTFEFEILFQNRFNRISPVPIWIMEGLSEHIAGDWNADGRMVLRDAAINGYLPDLEHLETFNSLPSTYLGYKTAQSAIDYIRDEYGIEKIRSLLWEMRKTLRTENYFQKAVKDIFGVSLRELSLKWSEDLRRRFIEMERRREGLSAYPESVVSHRQYSRRFSPVFQPGSNLIAFIQMDPDGANVYISGTDPEKKEPFDCVTCGMDAYKYRQFVMEGRPLHGNPWDDLLVYVSRRENRYYINILDPVTRGFQDVILLPYDQVSSPALSPDNKKIAFSAIENGNSDIFILDIVSGKSINITNDAFVDETPCWSPDGLWIAYSTERERQYEIYRIELSSNAQSPFILSPGNETMPAWSPDGKTLAYISDRQDGIRDVYMEDIVSGNIHRLTAPITGMFSPAFAEDSSRLAAAFYFDMSQNIVVINTERRPQIPQVAADVKPLDQEGEMISFAFKEYEPAAAVPSSPGELENAKVKFKLIPDAALGMISYGSTGDFAAEGGVLMSDILGDHQFQLLAIRRGNRNGILAQYLYLRNRIDFGLILNHDSDYYYVYDYFDGSYSKVEWKYFSALLRAEYPLSTFYRAEIDLGYFERRYSSEFGLENYYDEQLMYVEPAICGDTVKYKPLTGYSEPFSGQAFRFSIRVPIGAASEYSDYTNTYFDYRIYLPIRQRSLIAIREWGVLSNGEDAQYFGVGGFNTIRGYDYNVLYGNKVALTNIEIRFPFVDRLIFPGGIGFYGFRGKLFADAGAVWFNREDPEWKFDNPNTPEQEGNLFGSAGFGINFWMLGVEWHFEWARKTDFKKFGGDWVYQWSIRRSF